MHDAMPWLAPCLSCAAAYLLAAGALGRRSRSASRRRLSGRIARTIDGAGGGAVEAERGERMTERFNSLARRLGALSPMRLAGLRLSLVQAGWRREGAPALFILGRLAGAVLGGLGFAAGWLLRWPGLPPVQAAYLGLTCAYACSMVPLFLLKSRIRRRRQAFSAELPDALDMLVVCVEAGLGLDAALNRVCREIPPEASVLGEELHLTILELRAGKSRMDAFRGLARRTGLDEMGSLVAVLLQTESLGTSVGRALRVFAEDMRSKRHQRAEERAAKLPVQISIPLVLFIFPAIFVALLGPVLIRVFRAMH